MPTTPSQVMRSTRGVTGILEKQSIWSSRKRVRSLSLAVTYILIVIGGTLVSFPFYWMVSTSLKTPAQTFKFPPVWIPSPFVWRNYRDALTAMPFATYFKNTIKITVMSVAGLLVASSLAAYSFARLRWKGKHVLFLIVLSTMMLPIQVTMIPRFVLFRILGWIDTHKPLIVPSFFGSAFQIFLLRQFFLTIPMEMDEAARMDGCSIMGIYFRIILPLSKPALAAGALFAFRFRWNQFLMPLIYLNTHEKFTVALGLRLFQGEFDVKWHLLMAAATVAMLPLLTVFFLGQRYFIQGVVISGVKG